MFCPFHAKPKSGRTPDAIRIWVITKPIAYAICGALVALCFCLSVVLYDVAAMPVQAPPGASQKPYVIIDPGHGGIDGGAEGPGNIRESEINLQIALKLRDMLVMNGYDVIMTRDTDISIHSPDARSIRQKKTSDLHNRLDIMNSHPNAIVISIHQNKFSQSQYWGTQVFYGTQNPQSERLASIIQQNTIDMLQPENDRAYKKAYTTLFLMQNATQPAVLVECGFLSNSAELKRLCDDAYQNEMAFVLCASIIRFSTTPAENMPAT